MDPISYTFKGKKTFLILIYNTKDKSNFMFFIP